MSKNAKAKVGISYFLVHMCIEIICFYTLYSLTRSFGISVLTSAVFDAFAFVPQGIIGHFYNKHRKMNIGIIGCILMGISVIMTITLGTKLFYVNIIIMALGNAILHECGAISTVTVAEGKMLPTSLFVAGGSFGLIIGRTLGSFGVSGIVLIIALMVMTILVEMNNRYWLEQYTGVIKYKAPNVSNMNKNLEIIILVAFVVTTIRSFVAYNIPTGWRTELWQFFILYSLMGIGKALGGLLVDTLGCRKTAMISTILSMPFLIIGDKHMIISVFGIMLFSMTMSITYGMLLDCLTQHPGLAFGITTIALFLGILPVFFFKFTFVVNVILVIISSVLCAILLYGTTIDKKEVSEND